MKTGILFDLDGTLTDTLESLTYSVNATLEELHLPCITSKQCKSFVGSGARYLIECALKAAGDTELAHVEEIMSKLHAAYETVSKQDESSPVMANTQTVYAGLTYGRNNLNESLADQGSSRGFRA